jgi:hypothetical protein
VYGHFSGSKDKSMLLKGSLGFDAGWWFEAFYIFHLWDVIRNPLTNSYFSEVLVNHQHHQPVMFWKSKTKPAMLHSRTSRTHQSKVPIQSTSRPLVGQSTNVINDLGYLDESGLFSNEKKNILEGL